MGPRFEREADNASCRFIIRQIVGKVGVVLLAIGPRVGPEALSRRPVRRAPPLSEPNPRYYGHPGRSLLSSSPVAYVSRVEGCENFHRYCVLVSCASSLTKV